MIESRDIWFNAFLSYKGIAPKKYEKDNRKKITLFFDISEPEWQNLRLEFKASEFIKLKAHMEQIKELGY